MWWRKRNSEKILINRLTSLATRLLYLHERDAESGGITYTHETLAPSAQAELEPHIVRDREIMAAAIREGADSRYYDGRNPLRDCNLCEATGIDPRWWIPVVQTGHMAGSDYTTWRLHDSDIPRADWLRVEVCDGIEPGGRTKWRPLT